MSCASLNPLRLELKAAESRSVLRFILLSAFHIFFLSYNLHYNVYLHVFTLDVASSCSDQVQG